MQNQVIHDKGQQIVTESPPVIDKQNREWYHWEEVGKRSEF